jgi:hypothetical protein
LEGLKPTTFGLSLKERILAGEISIEQAQAELSAHYIQPLPESREPVRERSVLLPRYGCSDQSRRISVPG